MSSNIINPAYKTRVYLGIAATALAVGAVFTPWEEVKIIGLTVLTGVIYKVASNMIACRECIHFFSVDGHYYAYFEDHLSRRLVTTLDPNLNALVYAINTWHVNAIVGSILALLARGSFDSLKYKVTSAQLLPYFIIGAIVTLALSHFISQLAKKRLDRQLLETPMKDIEKTFYPTVPLEWKAQWAASRARHFASLSSFAIGGIALAGAILAAREGKIKLSNTFNF